MSHRFAFQLKFCFRVNRVVAVNAHFSPLSGVFAAAHDLNTEWILIKGIKDYANASQSSSDEWGVFASVMAVSVVANILSDHVVFQEWPRYNQGNSFYFPSYLCIQ